MSRALALACLVVLSAAPLARAAERESSYARIKEAVVKQLHPVANRHALSIHVGVGFGQEFTRDLQFGLSYRYHWSDFFGAGLTVFGGLAFESGLVGDIRAARAASLDNIRPEAQLAAFTADFHLVPIYGKFVTFGKYAVHYTLTFSAGVGGVLATGKSLDGQSPSVAARSSAFKIAPFFGASLRLLFSRGVGLTFEFRDYIWSERLATSSTDATGIGNHFSFSVGPVFLF
jgi:hypothetical protein